MKQKTPRPQGVGFPARGRQPAPGPWSPGGSRGLLGHRALGAAPAGLAVGAQTPKGAAPAPPLPACAREVSGDFPVLPRTGRPGRWWQKAPEGVAGPCALHSGSQQLFFLGWKD